MVLAVQWFENVFFSCLEEYKNDIHPVKAALPILKSDAFLDFQHATPQYSLMMLSCSSLAVNNGSSQPCCHEDVHLI